jgi:hypothetical protein
MKIKANELMPIEVADIIKGELDCIDHWEDNSGLLIKQYTREAFPEWSNNLIEALNIVFADILADEYIVNLSGGKLEIDNIMILKSSDSPDMSAFYLNNDSKRTVLISLHEKPLNVQEIKIDEVRNVWINEREIVLYNQENCSIQINRNNENRFDYIIFLTQKSVASKYDK